MNQQNSNTIDIASYIDHTLLKPETTKQQIYKLCEEALSNNFFAVCVNSSMIGACKEVLKSSQIKIASVVGFPLGVCDTSTKAFETTRAISMGAHEIDMVIHLGAVKAQDWSYIEKDIKDVVLAANGNIVKVILETHMLSQDEIKKCCELSVLAGAHFVKTSTGFTGGGAKKEDVALMKAIVGAKAQVKASGGIRDYATALEMIQSGATRLGTSSGVAIINHQSGQSGY